MRALIQRVSSAQVMVAGETIGAIGTGLVVLIAIGKQDGELQVDKLAPKIARLRVFEDDEQRMGRSLVDVGGAALCISQFTLYGDTRKGTRPSYSGAAEPVEAQRLYELLCDRLGEQGVPVERGIFGAAMSVALVNEGPVTLLVEA